MDLGFNLSWQVLPGPTWSTRRLKLARSEATKVERERERASDPLTHAGHHLKGLGQLAPLGGGCHLEGDVLQRALQVGGRGLWSYGFRISVGEGGWS